MFFFAVVLNNPTHAIKKLFITKQFLEQMYEIEKSRKTIYWVICITCSEVNVSRATNNFDFSKVVNLEILSKNKKNIIGCYLETKHSVFNNSK